MRKLLYIYILLVYISSPLIAQDILLTNSPVYLNVSFEIPEDLLSTKTAVIVEVGSSGLNWKEISNYTQIQLRRTGIDAVAYFHWKTVFSGFEPQQEISEFLKTRQVTNIILVRATKVKAEVWLTKFNNSWSVISSGQNAWYFSDSTVSKALLPLYQKAALEQERKNLLISDVPEYYEGLIFHKRKISKAYPPDVRGFKTGIALIPSTSKPEEINVNLQRVFETYQDAIMARNDELKNVITEKYPFKYEFYDFGLTMEELRTTKGCNFFLGYVYGRANDVTQMFKLSSGDSKEIITNAVLSEKPIIRSIPADRMVFKFYFRNTVTGEIFIGSVWDADVAINDALRNFIFYMKRDLKVNP